MTTEYYDIYDIRVLADVREMAQRGGTVSDIVRRIPQLIGNAQGKSIICVYYVFTRAFYLSLNEIRDIEDAQCFSENGILSDDEIDARLRPLIISRMQEAHDRDVHAAIATLPSSNKSEEDIKEREGNL